jgi:hypothetical protein
MPYAGWLLLVSDASQSEATGSLAQRYSLSVQFVFSSQDHAYRKAMLVPTERVSRTVLPLSLFENIRKLATFVPLSSPCQGTSEYFKNKSRPVYPTAFP